MRSSSHRRDRGQATLEHTAVLALAALLVGAVIVVVSHSDLPRLVATATCRVAAALTGGDGAGCSRASSPDGGAGPDVVQPWYCDVFGLGCSEPDKQEQGEHEQDGDEQDEDQPWYCDVFGLGCHDSTPGQGDLPPGIEAGSALADEMQATARGRETLQWLADHDVEVIVDPKAKGAYYSDDTIVLGDGFDSAPVLVHEGNHARYDDEGRHADPDRLDRPTFVRTAIAEEADGLVQQILAAKELRTAGRDAKAQPAEDRYDAAYAAARRDGRDDAGARQAGARAVEAAFYDGTLTASTSGQSYSDFYGEQWDHAH